MSLLVDCPNADRLECRPLLLIVIVFSKVSTIDSDSDSRNYRSSLMLNRINIILMASFEDVSKVSSMVFLRSFFCTFLVLVTVMGVSSVFCWSFVVVAWVVLRCSKNVSYVVWQN